MLYRSIDPAFDDPAEGFSEATGLTNTSIAIDSTAAAGDFSMVYFTSNPGAMAALRITLDRPSGATAGAVPPVLRDTRRAALPAGS